MSQISYGIIIDAPAEKIFDFISDVPSFTEYTSYVKEITELTEGKYLWQVRVLNIPLQWTSEVTENARPVRFAWKSVKGVYSEGSYTLTPADEGKTRVDFTMKYHLTDTMLDRVASPIISKLISDIYTELLRNIKKRLEGQGPVGT